MMRLAAIALIGAVSAVASAEVVVSYARAHSEPPLRQAESAVAVASSDAAPAATGSEAEVLKADDGHYWAEASVDGHEVRFLVDTGASAVALTPGDAERLGIDPSTLTYAYTVTTASGQARAASVKLASVSVGGAEVDDVQAYVIENGMTQSLLGMSYLGRLSQFEATKTAMILRP